MKYNILIGGSAGLGMDTFSALLEKILKREGYYIHSIKDYMSRVRGGHNFMQIRFGTEPINSHWPDLDLIVAFDDNAIKLHRDRLKKDGVILSDNNEGKEDIRNIDIPMRKIAREIGKPLVFGSVAMGAVLKIFGISSDRVKEVFEERFQNEILEANIEALNRGYGLVEKRFDVEKPLDDESILINGNTAIALGALAGGVSFYSAYPMTPSTSIMTYLSTKQDDAGIVVEQAEDEIAAINMALGASYAGIRSMTGTSGGGFSLMTETLGLVGITETPLVAVNVMRPGPATGLPTRTEQSDLNFVLTASHGEIPRMVIALRDPEDAFYQTVRALNLADKYQMLVIILNDQYLADCSQTIKPYDFENLSINRYIAEEEYLKEENKYLRYKITDNGISPRIIPGKHEGHTVLVDSDEHNEHGHITESAEVRMNMMEKRMKRLELLMDDIQEPKYIGDEKSETLLVGWGSTYGPLKEAVELLQEDGLSIGALVFGDIYPLPKKLIEKYSSTAKKVVNVEQNYTGQLAKLIRQETGIDFDGSILKYDGRQISSFEIYSKVKGEII